MGRERHGYRRRSRVPSQAQARHGALGGVPRSGGYDDLTTVCTPENRLPLDDTPVTVTSSPGEYVSPAVQDVRFPVVWREIATWIPSSGTPVDYHRGECGVAHEISTPAPQQNSAPASRLAVTGGAAPAGAFWLAGGLGLGGALMLLLAPKRRRRAGRSLPR